jgi:hypothetical protein
MILFYGSQNSDAKKLSRKGILMRAQAGNASALQLKDKQYIILFIIFLACARQMMFELGLRQSSHALQEFLWPW